jgi:uncharacterized membrane protein
MSQKRKKQRKSLIMVPDDAGIKFSASIGHQSIALCAPVSGLILTDVVHARLPSLVSGDQSMR